jgi:hypothetical protein
MVPAPDAALTESPETLNVLRAKGLQPAQPLETSF